MPVLAALVLAAAVLALVTFAAAFGSRNPAWQQVSVGCLAAAAVLWAVGRPAGERWWALVLAPLVALAAEAGRAAVDARRRSGTTHVEPAVWQASTVAAGASAMVGALAAVAVLAFVPLGTVPGGLLPAALGLSVAVVVLLSAALHRLTARRAAVRRAGPALALALVAMLGGAVVVGAGAEARTTVLRGTQQQLDAGGADTAPVVAGATATTVPTPAIDRSSGAAVSRYAWLMALVLLVAAIIAMVLFGQRQQLLPPEDLVPDPVSRDRLDIEVGAVAPSSVLERSATLAVVDDAIVALRADAVPRTAVRQAYATVTSGLGRHELVRAPAETEGEYLRRVLDVVGAGAGDLAVLTRLFSRARFSEDEIDESMRREALDALERIRGAVAGGGR